MLRRHRLVAPLRVPALGGEAASADSEHVFKLSRERGCLTASPKQELDLVIGESSV